MRDINSNKGQAQSYRHKQMGNLQAWEGQRVKEAYELCLKAEIKGYFFSSCSSAGSVTLSFKTLKQHEGSGCKTRELDRLLKKLVRL